MKKLLAFIFMTSGFVFCHIVYSAEYIRLHMKVPNEVITYDIPNGKVATIVQYSGGFLDWEEHDKGGFHFPFISIAYPLSAYVKTVGSEHVMPGTDEIYSNLNEHDSSKFVNTLWVSDPSASTTHQSKWNGKRGPEKIYGPATIKMQYASAFQNSASLYSGSYEMGTHFSSTLYTWIGDWDEYITYRIDDAESATSLAESLLAMKYLQTGDQTFTVSNGIATIQMYVDTSEDLSSWSNTQHVLEVEVPADTDTKFYRFRMD